MATLDMKSCCCRSWLEGSAPLCSRNLSGAQAQPEDTEGNMIKDKGSLPAGHKRAQTKRCNGE